MATRALNLDATRVDGFPVYSLTMEEKWNAMRLLLDYDRTRLIEDGIIGQINARPRIGLALLPLMLGRCACCGKLSPLDTFGDDERRLGRCIGSVRAVWTAELGQRLAESHSGRYRAHRQSAIFDPRLLPSFTTALCPRVTG
jgi:hypothetical protein